MYDVIIRGGNIVDGSGKPSFVGDVAIQGKFVAEVAEHIESPAKKEIDAKGKLVTPGWVDMHTHYDAQATWDPFVSPSGWHGVTTVVMGNCGVGFAPCRPEDREWLIDVMEGVEDIPGSALTEGIKWEWETFPEYLDALDKLPRTVDIATQVPHSALRAYVMGHSGAENDDATDEQMAEMKRLTVEALEAGALGFSTSRTPLHKSAAGVMVAGTYAQIDELKACAEALDDVGFGVFEAALDHVEVPNDLAWLKEIASNGSSVLFNLSQTWQKPTIWRGIVEFLESANAEGVPLQAQVAGRAIGILMNLRATAHPFVPYATYQQLAALPWEEQLAELKKPEVKARILADSPMDIGEFGNFIAQSYDKMFLFSETLDYEPDESQSVAARAKELGISPKEVAYDALMASDGDGYLYFPLFNYADHNYDLLHTLHDHDLTHFGLSDGGAHCGAICDAGMPTFMLTHWTRDRKRGDTLPLESIVNRQTRKTAELYGMMDRGLLEAGYRADVNVIDYEELSLDAPKLVYDLPAGGRRLVQHANGYIMTMCAGEITMENGESTDARPGKVVRGPQTGPAN